LNTNLRTIALVGQPNSGKSTLFNVLSDIKTSTGNFAGTTVAVKETLININFNTYRLIDLPGLYSLNPVDLAEELTIQYLLENKVDLIINVIDSTLLARSLELTVELLELGLPMIVALNLQDEAKRYGVKIDESILERHLSVPVVSTTALFGKGVKQLIEKADVVANAENQHVRRLPFTYHVEKAVHTLLEEMDKEITDNHVNKAFFAIKQLENPGIVSKWITGDFSELIASINHEVSEQHRMDFFETIASERHHLAMQLTHRVSTYTSKKSQPKSDKIDKVLLHPVFGYFFMALFFVFYFVAIFQAGTLITQILDPMLQSIPPLYSGLASISELLFILVDGLWQGIAGAMGIVLPYFIPLLLLTAIFEDTGYMARIAFLLDGLFHRIGLHGKSVAPFIMGFGCTVPAIYATRIIDNDRDRLITGVLINFIPCSARLTVIFALSAAFTGPFWTAGIFLFVLFIIAVNGKILSLFMSKPTGLVMEIPNLKLPSPAATYRKTYFNIREFIVSAVPLLVVGSIILALMEYFKLSALINKAVSPLVTFALGLPEQLGSTLIFGFLRKELIIVMSNQALNVTSIADIGLSVNQALTFTIFIILYIPCVATFGVLWREFGRRAVLFTTVFTLLIATLSAVLVRLVLLLFGIV
jgi:ferrous iron transport protein B